MTTEMGKTLAPAQIDRLAQKWNDLDVREALLEEEREKLSGEILGCVELQGELAERASKTQIVDGREWELRVTSSQTTSIDQKIAREFLAEVPRTLGEKIFRREEKFVLLETPDRLPEGANLGARVRRLFQQTLIIKPRAPKIEVRSRLAKANTAE